MPFNWATQKTAYQGKLRVQSLGTVNGVMTGRQAIVTNNATVTYVDCGTLDVAMTETVLGPTATASLGTGAANMYGLPWETGYAARTILGVARNTFVTTSLNGCGVLIGGPAATPTVIHANCQPTDLLTPVQHDLPTYYRLWSDVYVAIASQLVSLGLLPNAGVQMLLPKDYLTAGVSEASVFGVRANGNWSFYVTINKASSGETRKIWG